MLKPKTRIVFFEACFIVWIYSNLTFSKTIVETLPGFAGKLPFKFETGYIGVGESESVELFYYFFESENKPETHPLLLFLTGGPGCSAVHTIIYEIGPFTLMNNFINGSSTVGVELKPYSWTKVSNLLVIDQPAGCGYSYAKTEESWYGSDTKSALLTSQFIKKWLVAHPEYYKNDLYIGGDSYAGIFVPLVVEQIYNGNQMMDELPLNVKGYILGNPVTDKFGDTNGRVKYAHNMGLLSDELYESAKSNCEGNYVSHQPSNKLCDHDMQRISQCLDNICLPHILDVCCDAWTVNNKLSAMPSSHGLHPLLFLGPLKGWCQDHDFAYSYLWGNDRDVQAALNIRKGTIQAWSRCNTSISSASVGMEKREAYSSNVQSVVPIHRNLTYKHARALVYTGDHDLVVPRTSTLDWIESLGLTVQSEWRPWYVDGEIAGYNVGYSHMNYELTYATIKGGGHLPSEQKPKECFSMISRWFAGGPI
ncbi:hypothetical protein Leryth_009653 [Lithospermum erythrorhizon]|nr:hypothetical protein Leryth_009653 [Lithospermum erythrorhizon]